MNGITKRQIQVLRAVGALTGEKGYPPTVREIGARLGLSSSCTVQKHLDSLRTKGYLSECSGKTRTLRVLKAA